MSFKTTIRTSHIKLYARAISHASLPILSGQGPVDMESRRVSKSSLAGAARTFDANTAASIKLTKREEAFG